MQASWYALGEKTRCLGGSGATPSWGLSYGFAPKLDSEKDERALKRYPIYNFYRYSVGEIGHRCYRDDM